MRIRNLHNRKLDKIGDRLLKKALLSEAEIDRIALSPQLFDGVRKRIANHATARPKSVAWRPRVAFGGVFVLAVTIFASFYFAGRETETATRETRVPTVESENARPEITPQVISDLGITPGRAVSQKIAQKSKQPKTIARKRKPQSIPEVEFYPVTFAGDSLDAARGGRVIRVDMQRSSLFAMGVNVPLENEAGTVKADLLVGPDGVTRGIRLVE